MISGNQNTLICPPDSAYLYFMYGKILPLIVTFAIYLKGIIVKIRQNTFLHVLYVFVRKLYFYKYRQPNV